MADRRRLFVAVELPEAIRSELGRRGAALRGRFPAARWTATERAHVTLLFLGETASGRVAPVGAATEAAAAGAPRLTLALRDGGTFPPRRPARVAWVGIDAPPSLAALQSDLETRVGRVVEGLETGRRFNPHVTLARCRPPWGRRVCERFVEATRGPWGEPFEVEEIVLFESHLEPSGARHVALRRAPLGGKLATRGRGAPSSRPVHVGRGEET